MFDINEVYIYIYICVAMYYEVWFFVLWIYNEWWVSGMCSGFTVSYMNKQIVF